MNLSKQQKEEEEDICDCTDLDPRHMVYLDTIEPNIFFKIFIPEPEKIDKKMSLEPHFSCWALKFLKTFS